LARMRQSFLSVLRKARRLSFLSAKYERPLSRSDFCSAEMKGKTALIIHRGGYDSKSRACVGARMVHFESLRPELPPPVDYFSDKIRPQLVRKLLARVECFTGVWTCAATNRQRMRKPIAAQVAPAVQLGTNMKPGMWYAYSRHRRKKTGLKKRCPRAEFVAKPFV